MKKRTLFFIFYTLIFSSCNTSTTQAPIVEQSPKIPTTLKTKPQSLITKKEYQAFFETSQKALFVYEYQGDLDQALYCSEASFSFAKKGFGKTDIRTIQAHNKLCEMYQKTNNKEKAFECFKKIGDIGKVNKKIESLEKAKSYNGQALLFLEAKNFSKALQYAIKALKIRINKKGKDAILVADSYSTIAHIYISLNQYKKASPYVQKALNIQHNTWGKEDLRLFRVYYLASLLYAKQNNIKEAFLFQKKSFAMMLEIRKLLFKIMGNKSLEYYFQGKNLDMTNLLQIAFIAKKKHYDVTEESFNLWLKYKGSFTENKIKLRRSNRFNMKLDLNILSNINKKYTSLFLRYFTESLSKEEILELEKLKFEKGNLESKLHKKIKIENKINSLEISQKLAKDELYIDFTKVEKNFYYMFTLNNKNHVTLSLLTTLGQDVKKVFTEIEIKDVNIYDKKETDKFIINMQINIKRQLKEIQKETERKLKIQQRAQQIMSDRLKEEIEKNPSERKFVNYQKVYIDALEKMNYSTSIDGLIKKFRTQIKMKKDTKKLGNQLYTLLLKDSIPNISNYKKLIISSDGLLNLLPFEALTTDDGKYLIQKQDIIYINSGQSFLRAYQDKDKTSKSNQVVLLSNLNYEEDAFEKSLPSSKEEKRSLDNIFHDWTGISRLKSTQTEANFMRTLFGKDILLEYTENNGTKQLLYSLRSPKILHLSTHSFFGSDGNKSIDSLLKSALALSGYNALLSEEDNRGIMTALEFSNLNLLHTDLVFFSSCQSGLGDIYSSEGVEGLGKSAIIAGAKHVISTLWSVDDKETSILTRRFYTHLYKDKMSYVQALRQSKLEMINLAPYYWAGFIEHGID